MSDHDYNPPSEGSPDRLVHDAMKAKMLDLARTIKTVLPPGVGFSLFLFQFGPGGWITYISSASRKDMCETLREWLGRQGETMARAHGDTVAKAWEGYRRACYGDAPLLDSQDKEVQQAFYAGTLWTLNELRKLGELSDDDEGVAALEKITDEATAWADTRTAQLRTREEKD